jgi:hypothetical protein
MTSNQKAQNDAFIKKFKKDNKILTQTKIPTPVDEFNKKLIRDDCLLTDGMHWKKYVDEFKYDPMKHADAMMALLSMCQRCGCSPWQIVNLAVSNFGQTKFDDAAIYFMRDNMLSPELDESMYSTDEDDEDDVDRDDEDGNSDDKLPRVPLGEPYIPSKEDLEYIAEIARTGGNGAAKETTRTPRRAPPAFLNNTAKRARKGPLEEEMTTAEKLLAETE